MANELILELEHPTGGPLRQARPAARFERTPATVRRNWICAVLVPRAESTTMRKLPGRRAKMTHSARAGWNVTACRKVGWAITR